MRLEIKNPKRIEELHSLLPDFRLSVMTNTDYTFTSDWKGEEWQIILNRWPNDGHDKWNVEVRLVSRGECEITKVTPDILSNLIFFKAYIAKTMAEIWKSYLKSVI